MILKQLTFSMPIAFCELPVQELLHFAVHSLDISTRIQNVVLGNVHFQQAKIGRNIL